MSWAGKSLTAEGVIVLGELSLFVGLRHPLAELAVPQKQAFHLRGEVDVPVAGGRLRLFDRYVFACDLDDVAAKALCPVQSNGGSSLPFFGAAPYPVSRTAVMICLAEAVRSTPMELVSRRTGHEVMPPPFPPGQRRLRSSCPVLYVAP